MTDANIIYEKLTEEINSGFEGGLLDYTITEMSYHSNKIEGSTLTREQTQSLYDYDYISTSESEGENNPVKGDDIVEMKNHFRLIKEVIRNCDDELTQDIIKKYHYILKNGTKDMEEGWAIGDYKKLGNRVGNIVTTEPQAVQGEMKKLLSQYNSQGDKKTLDEIIGYHVEFEKIHPFQDGNGRVGRAIMLKEALKKRIIPFIIHNENKMFYYTGLKVYDADPNVLKNICMNAQKEYLEISKEFLG